MIGWLARGAILLAGGLLVGALLPALPEVRLGGLALVFLVISLWLGSSFARWDGFPTLGLLATVGMAATALYFGLNATLSAAALVAALIGWDLDLFAQRLRGFERIDPGVVSQHLRATATVAALALGLALLGLHVHLSLSFGLALLLAVASFASLVAILRLSRAV
ncbi:MAG: hypothetical protein ACE5LD_05075 [Candidatus Bipolaricaulia bacterium]